MSLRFTSVAFLAAITFGACEDDEFDDDVVPVEATDAVDATTAATWDTAFMYSTMDPFDDPFFIDGGALTAARQVAELDPEVVEASVGSAADFYFIPSGCAQVENAGTSLIYTLSNCTGPFDVRGISGTLAAAFERLGNGQLGVTLSSSNLRVDDNEAVIAANGVYSRDGNTKMVTFTSASRVDGDFSVVRQSTGTLSWEVGSQCINLDDTGTTVIGGRTFDVTVNDLSRCSDRCPRSGTVALSGSERSVTLTFDGSDSPDFTTADGGSGDLQIDCQP
jgi:hypothetical protein